MSSSTRLLPGLGFVLSHLSTRSCLISCLASCLMGLCLAGVAAALEIGKPVPPFSFVGEGGITYRSADAVGQRGLVVAWFPKAFTPG